MSSTPATLTPNLTLEGTRARLRRLGFYGLLAHAETQGDFDELLKNPQGTVRFEARNGKVIKFALLGSILKAKDVSALFKHGGAQLEKDGFSYRRLAVNGHFEGGQFITLGFETPADRLRAVLQ